MPRATQPRAPQSPRRRCRPARPGRARPAAPRLLAALGLCAAGCAPVDAAGGAAPRRWSQPPIASDQYESSPTFTPDGRELYFMRSDTRFQNWRILWSRCRDGAWSKPEPAPFAAAPPAVDADPFVTADGQRVYFISTRQSLGARDEFDIWMAARKPEGGWAEAERLPAPVNSPGSELLPRATSDGRLYFGSDRPGGHGQGDIYIATPLGGGGWSVMNAGRPISTAAYEYEADISPDQRTLVVVADRGERSHLYRYTRGPHDWVEQGRIRSADDVFQVGPLLSPRGDRLLFAQADGPRSGEIVLVDLAPSPDPSWPPTCRP